MQGPNRIIFGVMWMAIVAALFAIVAFGFVKLARADTNQWGAPVAADTVIVVTIDGWLPKCDSMFTRLDDSLMSWGAASWPDYEIGLDGITDPCHATILTGYHETLDSTCVNGYGQTSNPTIGHLLEGDALFVTAKAHLAQTIADGFGEVVLVNLGFNEGPDSLTYHVFLDSLASRRPAFAFLNLARFDKRAHVWTVAGYYSALDVIADEATDIICDLHSRLGDHVLLIVLSDHGRHCDSWPGTRPWTFHGHAPCGSELCECCNDGFLYFVGPSVNAGVYTSRPNHRQLGQTLKMIYGKAAKGEWPIGTPIVECFE